MRVLMQAFQEAAAVVLAFSLLVLSAHAERNLSSTASRTAVASNFLDCMYRGKIGSTSVPWATLESGRRLGFPLLAPSDQEFGALQTEVSQARRTQGLVPRYIGKPATKEDVALLVKCAGVAGLPMAIRNGGHNYEGMSTVRGGLVIHLGQLTGVTFTSTSASSVRVTVGAGILQGPFYLAITARNYLLPGGTCPGVGLSGLILGGGLGHSSRASGVTADLVTAATVVLADGRIVTASPSSNPDLFFAIRGGGGNYGAVTSWDLQLPAAPKGPITWLKYEWKYTPQMKAAGDDRKVFAAFNAWQPWKLSKRYALVELFLGYGGLYIEIYYWGPSADMTALIKANPAVFKAAPGGNVVYNKEYLWPDFLVQVAANPGRKNNQKAEDLSHSAVRALNAQERAQYKANSVIFYKPMPVEAQKLLLSAMDPARSQSSFFQIRVMGGATSEQPATPNAFPHRSATLEVQIKGTSSDAVAWVDKLKAAVVPYSSGYEYFNYFDCSTYKADPWEAYFGPNAPKLRAVKAKYDPFDRFNSINCGRINGVA